MAFERSITKLPGIHGKRAFQIPVPSEVLPFAYPGLTTAASVGPGPNVYLLNLYSGDICVHLIRAVFI